MTLKPESIIREIPALGSNEESRTNRVEDSNLNSIKDPDEKKVRILNGSFN
jgi:hypothetical protein